MTRTNLFLLAVLIICALAAITAQHEARKLFIDLEAEAAATKKLEEEWSQLRLELGTWATHKRVETVAAKQLGMRVPDATSTVVITEERR